MKDLRSASLDIASAALAPVVRRHPRWVRSLLTRLGVTGVETSPQGDEQFLDDLYQRLFGRPLDPGGRETYLAALSNGASRVEIALSLATSPEYRSRWRDASWSDGLEGPRQRRPDSYRFIPELTLWVFEARDRSDFDWLEGAVIGDGYYEHAGVWTLEVDTDKRVMAEIVGSLARRRVLELGCASGAVLEGLHQQGLSFEGVDVSDMARERASEHVKEHIHLGDLLSLDLGSDFDTAFGLDIFEHLNPNKLDGYIAKLKASLVPGGLLFANIPAFGKDEVFGEPFPYYLAGWEADAAAGRCFHTIHVDTSGYPINGHLIWADTRWWVHRFQSAGLTRRPSIERALHDKYDAYMAVESPARLPFYVFSAGDCPDEMRIIERISQTPSAAVPEAYRPPVNQPPALQRSAG
jgi:SAM-dependent methyltransferase